MSNHRKKSNDLIVHWIIVGVLLCILIAYNIICHTINTEIQINIDKDQRIFIRSILYIIAIALFPITSLLRHILLRLNQTMPGHKTAKKRYFITIATTLITIETIGLFGLIMFILGDEYNSLYIFSALATLGVFLHRPKKYEYEEIKEALRIKKLQNE